MVDNRVVRIYVVPVMVSESGDEVRADRGLRNADWRKRSGRFMRRMIC